MVEDDSKSPESSKEEKRAEQPIDGNAISLFLVIVPFAILLCSLFYSLTYYDSSEPNVPIVRQSKDDPLGTYPPNVTKRLLRKRVKVHQPNCTNGDHLKEELKNISSELYIKKGICTPEDVNNIKKHSVPNMASNNNIGEPRSHFVIYIAVGLLLTSLLAAFLDVYKVKGRAKTKPQLTKRCSLADLTVLRHSRRESMKKDSMMDEHRAPLKLLDSSPINE